MNNYSLLGILFLKSGHSPPHAAQRIDLEQPRLRPLSIRPIYFISILNHILIQHGTPGPVPVFHCYGATAILHVMGRSLPVMHVSPRNITPSCEINFKKQTPEQYSALPPKRIRGTMQLQQQGFSRTPRMPAKNKGHASLRKACPLRNVLKESAPLIRPHGRDERGIE